MTMSSNLAAAIDMIGADVKSLAGGVAPGGPLTRPKNNIVAIIGDSITNQCSTLAGGTENYGYLSCTQRQCDARFVFPLANNFGVGGDTTTQIRVRTPNVVASGAGIVIMLGGTNDRTSGLTVATSMDNYLYMRDQFIAAGQFVIAIVPMPRGSALNSTTASKTLTPAQLADALRFRDRILKEMPKAGCLVVDTYPAFANPLSTSGQVIEGYLHDGLHPNPSGAWLLGSLIAPKIKEILGPDYIFPTSNSDVYDVTVNPFGLVSANPMMTGTTGTPATGGTGDLATSWRGSTASTATGVTRTYSKVVKADGKEWQQVVLGGAVPPSNGRLDVLVQTGLETKVVAGGVYEIVGRWELDAGSQFFLSIQPGISVNSDPTIYDGDRYDPDQNMPSGTSGVFRSPQVTMPTPTDVRLLVSCYVSALGIPTATMRFTDVGLRRVS